jgi:hypothetical protein
MTIHYVGHIHVEEMEALRFSLLFIHTFQFPIQGPVAKTCTFSESVHLFSDVNSVCVVVL